MDGNSHKKFDEINPCSDRPLIAKVPLTGESRTYRYAFIYVYIYRYISTLPEKSFEIYLYILLKGVKEGFRAGLRALSHVKKHTRPGSEVSVPLGLSAL